MMSLNDIIREMEKEQRISIVRYCGFRGSAKAVFNWLNMLAQTKPLQTRQWHQHYLEKAWVKITLAIYAKQIDEEYLALAETPFEGRALLIDPESMIDLHKN